ncbi:queuosine 5'-phosphate N-glycosylase/hydrolase-like [Styela clava]
MALPPRKTGKLIASHCEDVFIDDQKVAETAKVLMQAFKQNDFSLKGWKNHVLHPKVADEKAIDIIFAIDVLNFSFWPDIPGKKYAVKYGGKLWTGYWSLVAALKRAEDEGKPVYDSEFMAEVEKKEFSDIFRSDTEIEIPLLDKRFEGFKESGRVLLEKFNGSFINCIRQCERDAVTLMNLVVENFPSFRDESVFQNQRVAFYKRAQILVADIWCCFEGKGLGEFTNIDEITMFADYRVPQSLEYFEILKYSEELKKALSQRIVFPPGHRFELEIRGSSIEAIERLTSQVRKLLADDDIKESKLSGVNSITVDNFLWDYAREHREKINHLPFHLVRTIFY